LIKGIIDNIKKRNIKRKSRDKIQFAKKWILMDKGENLKPFMYIINNFDKIKKVIEKEGVGDIAIRDESETLTGPSNKAMADDIIGKFQICLIVREFIDTGEKIEIQPVADYAETCQGWNNTKKALDFFVKRTEKKLNGG